MNEFFSKLCTILDALAEPLAIHWKMRLEMGVDQYKLGERENSESSKNKNKKLYRLKTKPTLLCIK